MGKDRNRPGREKKTPKKPKPKKEPVTPKK